MGALSASPRPTPPGSFVKPFSLGSPSPVLLSLLHIEAWGPPQLAGLKLLCVSESPDGDPDGHWDHHIEWGKSYREWKIEEKYPMTALYTEKMQINYLQNRKWLTDLEKKLCYQGDRKEEREGVWDGHVHTMFKMDNQQGPTVQHGELCSMLCCRLDGRRVWGRDNGYVFMYGWIPLLCTTLLIGYITI